MINNAEIDHTFACSWGHDLKHTYSGHLGSTYIPVEMQISKTVRKLV